MSSPANGIIDYSLEYLAVLAAGVAFDDAILDFCQKFSLNIESSEPSRVAASGTDFSATVRIFSNRVTLLTVLAEGDYELQNARELIDEQAIGDFFSEMTLLRDSVGELRTLEAYKLLNELENTLRKTVAVRAAALSSDDWLDNRVKRCLPVQSRAGFNYEYERRKNRETNDNEITERGEQPHHDIFYLDLSVLKTIINGHDNWKDGFKDDFKVLRNFDRLDLFNKLRRKIAHNRFLSRRNLDDLREVHGHLMHLCRRVIDET